MDSARILGIEQRNWENWESPAGEEAAGPSPRADQEGLWCLGRGGQHASNEDEGGRLVS